MKKDIAVLGGGVVALSLVIFLVLQIIFGVTAFFNRNDADFDLQSAAKKAMLAELPTTHPEMHSPELKYCYKFANSALLGCLVEYVDPQYRRMQTVLPVVWK